MFVMIEIIKNTSVFKGLKLGFSKFHAYLFHSVDKELNNYIALNFAKSLICENKSNCNACFACKQFNSMSHPDVSVIQQATIKVEDALNIINKLNTKPISANNKVFVVLNIESMNETAQNKLLKSLEEPNPSNIFIFTCSQTDKILPTVLSRLNKIYVPKLTQEDKLLILNEMPELNKFKNSDFNLTEMLNFNNNPDYSATLSAIKEMFQNLKSSADIPRVSTNLMNVNKTLFFHIFEDLLLDSINDGIKFDKELIALVKISLPEKAIIKSITLIEEAYKMFLANVNFGQILDNLLFNILKEKFLCK